MLQYELDIKINPLTKAFKFLPHCTARCYSQFNAD